MKCFWNWYQKEKMLDPFLKVVVSDVRFLHEFNFLQEKGAYIIKVIRNTDILDNHISENELDILKLDDFNGVIENNGTKEELYEKIADILN